MRDIYSEQASKLFHEWAAQPCYEKMDEDMALDLVARIASALRLSQPVAWPTELIDELDYLISELKDHGRPDTNRMGGFHTAGEAFCGLARQAERFRERWLRARIGGKDGVG